MQYSANGIIIAAGPAHQPLIPQLQAAFLKRTTHCLCVSVLDCYHIVSDQSGVTGGVLHRRDHS